MANLTVNATEVRPLIGAVVRQITNGDTASYTGRAGFIAADGELDPADASSAAGVTGQMGLIVAGLTADTAGVIDAAEVCTIVLTGPVYMGKDAAMDESAPIYFSEDAGRLTQTKPTISRIAGYAMSPTVMMWNPDPSGPSS